MGKEFEEGHMYNQITLLYIWNYHNIVNELYSKIKFKNKKFKKYLLFSKTMTF